MPKSVSKIITLNVIWSIITIMLFLASCKKNSSITEINPVNTISVEEAKSWLGENSSTLDLGDNWNKALKMNPGTNQEILKVRINESYHKNGTWVFRDILFHKDENGNIEAVGQKVFVDSTYLAHKGAMKFPSTDRRSYIDNSDFTGKIVFYTIENKPISGLIYKNGKAIYALSIGASKSRGGKNEIMGTAPNEEPLECYGSGLDDHVVCEGSGGEPFDGGDNGHPLNEVPITSPTPTQPPIIIWPIPSTPTNPGSNPDFPIGNPGGNTSNGSGNASAPILTNKLTDPCMSKILDETLNHNGSKIIKDILQNLGESPLIDLSFQNVASLDNGADARIQPTFVTNPYGQRILTGTIYFNDENLVRASKEYISVLIIHEAIHAYFRSKTGKQEPFDEMDHSKMSKEYVDPMTTFIVGMYGISATDASSIIWRGLSKTQAYATSETFAIQESGQTISVPKLIIEQTGVNYLISNQGTFKCD